MSVLFHGIQQVFKWVEENTDPRVKDMWLMGSVVPLTVIVVCYLTFVLKIGPEFMRYRKPYNIDRVVIVYNVVQILFSVYAVEEGFRLIWLDDDTRLFCYELSKSDPVLANQAKLAWIVFSGKYLDFLDTIFYVLRKKQNQVTFLHVYHHTLVVVGGWWFVNFHAGVNCAFFGTINSSVHIIMYTYYLLTTIDSKYKKAWWKKYLTTIQLLQFIILGLHGTIMLMSDCKFPRYLITLFLPQSAFMFILFWDFYQKSYVKKIK